MITNFFIPELNNHDVQELWIQQHGPTCQTARATFDLLKDTFGDRLISRFGPVNWPPRSCDLSPLDYFLWGYVKSLVYADKPQTLDHLENNIRHVIADIQPQMLEKVIENWKTRLKYIRASCGNPMPEIIFKMKEIRGSRNSDNVEGRGWNERRMSNVGNNRGNWRNSEVVRRPNKGRNFYRVNYENSRQGNQWFESRNRFEKNDRRFNDRGNQFRNRGQNDDFSRGDQRNKGSSENFNQGDRRQMGRLNVLKVSDVKDDQMQSINELPVKLSAICMSPVELPYIPILLNETFTKAL
ncbi:uncharacterized protein TNCV_4213631 [Trichonephila clavipes]|nr:uncharacterized protein TNCV_4213631 [Trichonephila clavipes]